MTVSAQSVQVLQKSYGDEMTAAMTEAGAREALEGRAITKEADRLALAEFLQKICNSQLSSRILAVLFPDRRNIRPRGRARPGH